MVLLVDLDTQKGKPTEHEALRVVGNLTTPDGALAPPEMVKRVGIGTRVRMVFSDVADGLALPQWTIDESATQPDQPWRYPEVGGVGRFRDRNGTREPLQRHAGLVGDVVADEAQQKLKSEQHRQRSDQDGARRGRHADCRRSHPVGGAEYRAEDEQDCAEHQLQRGDVEVPQEVGIEQALEELARVLDQEFGQDAADPQVAALVP